jgi:predicted nucleic acid-binding protein
MDSRLEQLTPETVDRLARKAQAEGLSLDAYLNVLLGLLTEGMALAEMSEAEFEAFIDDFSKSSEHFPALPPDFSRADIYTDHD